MRTYEPFKYLGRRAGSLYFTFLRTEPNVPRVSHSHTWEVDGQYRFGLTTVWRPFLRLPFAVGVGRWGDTDVNDLSEERAARHEQERADAEFNVYVVVNGEVDRAEWDAARKYIADQGLDPDDEMEIMQSLGLFA